jgi:hypothetical protein
MSTNRSLAYLMPPLRRQAKIRHLAARDEPPRAGLSYHALCGVIVSARGDEKTFAGEHDDICRRCLSGARHLGLVPDTAASSRRTQQGE